MFLLGLWIPSHISVSLYRFHHQINLNSLYTWNDILENVNEPLSFRPLYSNMFLCQRFEICVCIYFVIIIMTTNVKDSWFLEVYLKRNTNKKLHFIPRNWYSPFHSNSLTLWRCAWLPSLTLYLSLFFMLPCTLFAFNVDFQLFSLRLTCLRRVKF